MSRLRFLGGLLVCLLCSRVLGEPHPAPAAARPPSNALAQEPAASASSAKEAATGAAPPAKAGSAAAPAASALPIPPQQVVDFVSHTIAWYRHIGSLQQLPIDPEDMLPRDRLNKNALTAVRLAFDFGRGAATLAARPVSPGTNASDNSGDGQITAIDRAAGQIGARMAALQTQLNQLDAQLAKARPKERATLSAKRGEVAAALDLTKEIQATVQQIQHFEDASEAQDSGGGSGLAGQIADLKREVPEIRREGGIGSRTAAIPSGTGSNNPASTSNSSSGANSSGGGPPPAAAATPSTPTTTPNATFRPESAGVITLVGKWFSLEGGRRQLADAIKQTDAQVKELDGLRNGLTQEARALAHQDLSAAVSDPAQLLQAKQQLDAAASRFRQLSTLLVPLGEESITLTGARTTLDEWRDSLIARGALVARYLALRLGLLLGSIAIVLFISEVWRRATFRYLHDARRRQQFLALRRVAVGIALTLVIMFGLVTEVGSLATYAGLITAGLAVALQNVILAVVAYFFLIGRYGVRVGDRITLAGVTGRVVEIGLVRIYLMELTGPELRSSGRMVVLSNAVLFQPSALFKQMPGGDYFWHTIRMTVAATADVALAEKRLREAAESVYEKYRQAIEQQHAALQRFIDFETAMPGPEVFARLTIKGLECTVRYPVDPSQAAVTDQKMLSALREALSQTPELQLVDGPLLNTDT